MTAIYGFCGQCGAAMFEGEKCCPLASLVRTPEAVVGDFLSGLPYDFPDDANPLEDAAGVLRALKQAGYSLSHWGTS